LVFGVKRSICLADGRTNQWLKNTLALNFPRA